MDLLPRDDSNSTFSAGPPGVRSRQANHSTLLVSWWCTGFALVIILIRLWGRYERTRKFFMEDKIVALSIIPLLIRMGLAHPILLFGTNNIATVNVELTAQQIHYHSIGARLVLASRIFYGLFIWTAKFAVSEYLKRLVGSIWTEQYQKVLRFLRMFLVVTFLGVVIATLSECQPFDHYWQVMPDPGPKCRNGYSQLMTMGLCDIITDVLLIAFPMHLIWKSTMPLKRKLTLSVLFSLSLILIAITSYRMYAIIDSKGRQQLRTLWASLEILAAAAVSNALVLGSFLRDRGVKRAKFSRTVRSHSVSTTAAEPSINRTMTQQHWGNDSDEDLFRSLRGRLGSVTESMSQTSKVPPLPSKRFAREGSDIEARGNSDDSNSNFWSSDISKEKSSFGLESASVANSLTSETPMVHSERLHTASTVAYDFGGGHRSRFSHHESHASNDTTDLADVGGLLHYSPPPTATAASQQRRDSSNDLIRVASSSSSNTHLAFHTPHRAPRFTAAANTPSQENQAPASSTLMPTLARADTNLSMAISLQDAGGLLGAPHVSANPHSSPMSSRQSSSIGKSKNASQDTKVRDQSVRRFLGLDSWRHRRDGSASPRPAPASGTESKEAKRIDPMQLQDPGGLLG